MTLKLSKMISRKDLNNVASDFDDHLIIKKIKGFLPGINVNNFNFELFTIDNVKKEVLILDLHRNPPLVAQ